MSKKIVIVGSPGFKHYKKSKNSSTLSPLGILKVFGIVKEKVDPTPNLLVKEIVPPCKATNLLVNDNPRPVPGSELTYSESTLLNSLKINL